MLPVRAVRAAGLSRLLLENVASSPVTWTVWGKDAEGSGDTGYCLCIWIEPSRALLGGEFPFQLGWGAVAFALDMQPVPGEWLLASDPLPLAGCLRGGSEAFPRTAPSAAFNGSVQVPLNSQAERGDSLCLEAGWSQALAHRAASQVALGRRCLASTVCGCYRVNAGEEEGAQGQPVPSEPSNCLFSRRSSNNTNWYACLSLARCVTSMHSGSAGGPAGGEEGFCCQCPFSTEAQTASDPAEGAADWQKLLHSARVLAVDSFPPWEGVTTC